MKTQTNNTRLYLGGGLLLILAVLVFAQAAFNLSFITPSETNEIVLLYALSTMIFLALLVFGFVLLRILVKVWSERRQEKPGSRFKTRLLAMIALLTLIPAISVFAYAFGYLNRSIDKWFSVPVDNIFGISRQIEASHGQWHRENAQALLLHLSRSPSPDLEGARRDLNLGALLLVDDDGSIADAAAQPGVDLTDVAERAANALAPSDREAFFGWNGEWIGARRIQTSAGPRILAGVFAGPAGVADLSDSISREKTNYDELKARQFLFRNQYAAVLALMTVLVLFAAVWVGLFLSKRITKPIEALAAATREISAGNLSHRIDIEAEDELGMLVELFNNMASRLKATTDELETRRRYIEIILESIPAGVISVDSDLRVHTLNRAARTMFSVEGASRLDEIFKGDDLAEIMALLSAATEKSIAREIAFHMPGSPAHSAMAVNRLSAGGFLLVVEDLTEVVRAQKASAWREVARRLAHEIKNPLTPIQLSAERISRNIGRLPSAPPRVTAIMQECVGAIVDEVSSLKNLVDEFVRFARLPAVSRVPHNMRELVDRTLALYEGRMDGVDVAIEVPRDLPPILMDPMQMKRVFTNLIDNALEALSAQRDRALSLRCELARDGTMARLTIADNGSGIAPEDRERLFTPYFSTRKEGTGLGLAIASRIIADHGGYIGVEPNIPRGTRFVIELPVCQESSLSTTSPVSDSR